MRAALLIRTIKGKKQVSKKDNCEGLNTGVLGQATDDSNGQGARVKSNVCDDLRCGQRSNFPL